MKRIKKAWAVLLCFCMAVTLLPMTAFAADLGVTVNGMAVTDENAADVLGNGTASYDAATNTLTLNGANLTQIQNNTGKAFTIKVVGDNTVAIDTGSTNLIESNAPLTITGAAGATLKLSGANRNSYIKCINAEGSVTVEMITLILTNSSNAGISSTGNITIKNGAIVKGDTGNMLYATSAGAGKLTISDSTVTAPLEGTTVSGWMTAWVNEMDISNSTVEITVANGIYAANDIVIRDHSDVKVTASGKMTPFPGIYASGSMTIADSTVEGVSYTFSGLYATKDLTITDSSVKAVTTSGKYAALNAGGDLKINGAVAIETEAASGVSYVGTVIFEVKTPAEPADAMYEVYAGTSKGDAVKVEGSPFAANTDVTEHIKDSEYFSIVAHNHAGGKATCESGAICKDCGREYGEKDPANHTNLKMVKENPATHLKEGNTAYWHCDGCGKYYSDADGKKEITLADTVIEKLTEHTADDTGWHFDEASHWNTCECKEKLNVTAHAFKWITDKEATATEAGSKHEECSVCGYAKAVVEIPATGTTEESSKPKETTGTTGESSKPKETTDAGKTDAPQTGDNSSPALWAALLLLAFGSMTGIALYARKRKTN